MIKGQLVQRMESLLADREPFVTATVVRARKPTSVMPGDSALVLKDGTIEGFVGGVCAQASVRLHAARVLETGEAILLRLLPGVDAPFEGDDVGAELGPPAAEPAGEGDCVHDGVVVAHNPCLSGGALEIFLEPQLAAPRMVVIGETPIARAIAEVAGAAGYDVQLDGEPHDSDAALIVASHGEGEEAALARALEAGVGYVGLVASRKRGDAVRDSLDVPDALRAQIHTPAGLDIGAHAPAEVAIAILAELIALRTAHAPAAPPAEQAATTTDPICGMEVVVSDATPHLEIGGDTVYFCCDGCKTRYAADVAAR
jgi:xanthine dehydrogenase accessory factor